MDELLTPEEAAKYLKIKVRQVYVLMDQEENPLPYVLVSNKTKRIRKQDIIDWIARKAINI